MSTRRAPLFAIVLVFACGEPKKTGPSAEEAQAAAKKADEEAREAAAVAERKAKREAEAKAKAAADEQVKAELERLSALPAKLPKDPVAACEAVGQAQDAYVRRLGDKDAIAAWDAGGKDKAVPMAIVQCTQADSVKTAACQKHMFDNAGPELKDSAKAIMQTCIDKYGSTRKPPAGMPQKRPG